MLKKDVVEKTGLSKYLVASLSKQLDIGTVSGKTVEYTEEDVVLLQQAAHYRKYRKTILKMFSYIKKHPGCTEKQLKKFLSVPQYHYDVSLTELTHMCFFWEDIMVKNNKEVSQFYIDGNFFENYSFMQTGVFNDLRKKEANTVPEEYTFSQVSEEVNALCTSSGFEIQYGD